MSIRIRKVNSKVIAICGALSKHKEGDLYLDDSIHEALHTKFWIDFYSAGFMNVSLLDNESATLMQQEQDGLLF